MLQPSVAVLDKGLPLPAHCALFRNIGVALNEALLPIVLVNMHNQVKYGYTKIFGRGFACSVKQPL